jgi:hypothetical protein
MVSYAFLVSALGWSGRVAAAVGVPEMHYGVGWSRATAPPSMGVSFEIHVRQQNLAELRRRALEVSTPSSPSYGHFLKQAEIDALTAPAAADVAAVTGWLAQHPAVACSADRERLLCRGSVAAAGRLLRTQFFLMSHAAEQRGPLVRASSYTLPAAVDGAVAAIFGLHGLPLPRRRRRAPPAAEAASVTPAVLASTYGIAGVTAKAGDTTYRQAVAEFQGQYMNATDLAAFFAKYVPGAKPGDEKVFKFVGAPAKDGVGVEAELDIQYMMGVSPGVATEFWEYPASDFCADLASFTNTMLTGDDQPVVFSISYGWQGDLSQVQCTDAKLAVVDGNFAKAAAKGISVLVSSGDSGSGYNPGGACSAHPGKEGIAVTEGTVVKTITNADLEACCLESGEIPSARGWTWTPPPNKTATAAASATALAAPRADAADPFTFKAAPYHAEIVVPGTAAPVAKRDIWVLDGAVTAKGGSVAVHSANGSFPDTHMVFAALQKPVPDSGVIQLNVSQTFGKTTFTGLAVFIAEAGVLHECVNFQFESAARHLQFLMERGPNPPPPPPRGSCVVYSEVTKTGPPAVAGVVSGGPDVGPGKPPQLWPSWPASSPWVTAVGATRFVAQTAGQPEMGTDQFGSGGGFSAQFGQSPDATWQSAAVATYLATVDPSTLPPADAFDPQGRGTPDVAALGEGYQVVVGGHVTPVGGTSASCPAVAGMVSLLNQARLAKGGKQMGFLNPWLYANADAWKSVDLGSDKFGRGGGQPLAYGYNCTKGWDPVTGLGTPLFAKLLAAI